MIYNPNGFVPSFLFSLQTQPETIAWSPMFGAIHNRSFTIGSCWDWGNIHVFLVGEPSVKPRRTSCFGMYHFKWVCTASALGALEEQLINQSSLSRNSIKRRAEGNCGTTTTTSHSVSSLSLSLLPVLQRRLLLASTTRLLLLHRSLTGSDSALDIA